MTPTPAAVVFDLDYTLAVTDRDRQALLDEATDSAGASRIDREAYLAAHDGTDADETRAPIFEQLVGDGGDPATVATAYRSAIGDALEPVPGVADLLRTLRTDYRLGLLTDGPRLAQREKIQQLGWGDCFDSIVITGTLGAGKPEKGAFLAVCAELGVDTAEAVYVGDRPDTDVRGAKAAGMAAVQVLFPGGPDPAPEADAAIDREELHEGLPAVLASL